MRTPLGHALGRHVLHTLDGLASHGFWACRNLAELGQHVGALGHLLLLLSLLLLLCSLLSDSCYLVRRTKNFRRNTAFFKKELINEVKTWTELYNLLNKNYDQ